MAGRFIKAIENIGRVQLWNVRCKITVEWEKENGITSMSKRAKGRNCVGEHNSSRSGFIDLSLRQRSAAEVTVTRKEADERLLKSYLKTLHLNVMERLDSCKFMMMVESG